MLGDDCCVFVDLKNADQDASEPAVAGSEDQSEGAESATGTRLGAGAAKRKWKKDEIAIVTAALATPRASCIAGVCAK